MIIILSHHSLNFNRKSIVPFIINLYFIKKELLLLNTIKCRTFTKTSTAIPHTKTNLDLDIQDLETKTIKTKN